MGLGLLRHAHTQEDPGPQPLKYASLTGRQLYAMGAAWPELSEPGGITGLYHALGREKIAINERVNDGIVAHMGFDAFKPAALIFEHTPYGPFAHLALGLGCLGPFWTLEGDELSGALAFVTALGDLARGRCDRALVGAYRIEPAEATLCLLGREASGDLVWKALYTHGLEVPGPGELTELAIALGQPVRLEDPRDLATDPHGLKSLIAALGRAQEGEATAVWSCSADGRGLLMGFGRRS